MMDHIFFRSSTLLEEEKKVILTRNTFCRILKLTSKVGNRTKVMFHINDHIENVWQKIWVKEIALFIVFDCSSFYETIFLNHILHNKWRYLSPEIFNEKMFSVQYLENIFHYYFIRLHIAFWYCVSIFEIKERNWF